MKRRFFIRYGPDNQFLSPITISDKKVQLICHFFVRPMNGCVDRWLGIHLGCGGLG
ncbi:hypothetical protein OKW98_02575 [Pseudomonas sp. KU26590]|uniref:hypothetical protein n=1 Tax=Pseudomonas sp. KU26590 TaxID=2991051 RepID=UPI00223DB7AC|nr:hypothetical protein [Pseudomonas sp. KU26590]UZJ60648.1 hypothetical protein OKW98_02575 [Pseudomonas sp. KU26590]